MAFQDESREFTQELGFKLRAMREYLKLTLNEAAKKCKITNTNIAAYEGGGMNPNFLYVYNITKECGLDWDDLMLDTGEFMKKLYFR